MDAVRADLLYYEIKQNIHLVIYRLQILQLMVVLNPLAMIVILSKEMIAWQS